MRSKGNFRDCNENSWQVMLIIGGQPTFFSARAAAAYLRHEIELWEEGENDKAAKMRFDRQVVG
jgi:hypothetical protein